MIALEKQDATERANYLNEACGQDVALRRQVEGLLRKHEQAGSFLERPAIAPEPTGEEIDRSNGRAPIEGAGTRIGPYKLLQQIGEGGMGVVYMAEQQEPVRRKVALKIIKPGMDSNQVIARFEAERQALAMMDHTNIAKVFDAATTDTGRPYFVMELVHGVPITQFCDDNQLTPRERLQLFVPVCHAIQHAHQKGIIHRDIKPSNVLVTLYDDKPVPKVIDFGVAKAIEQRLTEKTLFTQFGALVGTFEYMSPEQAEMNAFGVDTRSDIYSLGVLLYELLTGTTPLERERLRAAALDQVVRLIKEEEAPRPSVRLSSSNNLPKIAAARKTEPAKLSKLVRGEIDWIVMKCLEKDRSRRYETTNGLARDVERYLHDEPVTACPPSASYRLRKFARKYRIPVITAAAFGLLLVIGVVVSAWQAVRATDAERAATKNGQETEAAREQARTAEAEAKAEAERTRRLYYAASMGLVQAAWENHNILQLQDFLAETSMLPERGFEWFYWQRLRHVEHLTLAGHRGGVTAVAFSPGGQRLVTGVTDGTARVWDATSGQEIFSLRGHQGQVTAVAFAPDGHWLVTGSTDGTARIWNAANGRELRRIQGKNTGAIWAVAVTPDGKRVVTGNQDHTARVWDVGSAQEFFTLRGHTGPVWAVAASPDGRWLVTGSRDGTFRLWDARKGISLGHRQVPVEGAPILVLFVSADSQRLVMGSGGGMAMVWDIASGRKVQEYRGTDSVTAFALTPDDNLLFLGDREGGVTAFERGTGREVLKIMGHRRGVSSIAVSPDCKRLATASWDGTARVWDFAKGRGTLTFKQGTSAVTCLALTHDGKSLIIGNQDGTTGIWDMISNRKIRTFFEFPEIKNSIRVFPGLQKGPSGGYIPYTGPVTSVAITPKGQQAISAFHDGTVRIWDFATGKELLAIKAHKFGFESVALTPDGKRIVTGSWDNTAKVWDASDGRHLLTLQGHTGPLQAVTVTPDGKRLITESWDATARIWDASDGRHLLTLKGHTDPIWALALTPDGKRLVTGSSDGTARVWDMASGREILCLKGHAGGVSSVAVTPDSLRIVTGSFDGTAKVWDSVEGRNLLTLKGHAGPVRCVALTPDGRRLITGGEDGTIRIWEAASAEQVALWAGQDRENARRQAIWQRPGAGGKGFIQDWLVLAPIPLDPKESPAEAPDRQKVAGEATMQPQAGESPPGLGPKCVWQTYHGEEPVLDFNRIVGRMTDHCVAYAVCYVISDRERNDLLLQVGSDDEAKVYLNGQKIYKYARARSLWCLDRIGPVTLHKGTNVLVFKVVNEFVDWLGCMRFVDADGHPAQGLRFSVTPE